MAPMVSSETQPKLQTRLSTRTFSSMWVAGNPYTLELSTDVGNDAPGVGAVPEPATWAMMGIGFAVLALFYRRRIAGTRLGFAA